jgi:O-antigen/teichoic acid export membrane protein
MNAVRTGIIYSSLSRYGLKLIALISSVLFARLLTPVEIGTFAIASSLVMLLAEVRLLGASVYLVRERLWLNVNYVLGHILCNHGKCTCVSGFF